MANGINFQGFSKLGFHERLQALVEMGFLQPAEAKHLLQGGVQSPDLADHFIENAIGYFQLPLGVATYFKIDQKDYLIPMAVEETSIIAAASKTAKWIQSFGKIETRQLGKLIIGQIQIAKSNKPEQTQEIILNNKTKLLELANQIASGLVRRGGGVEDISVRIIPRESSYAMVVIHVLADPCDAMGANIMNQICEGLKPQIEALTAEKVSMCILSNLVDTRLTEARIVLENIDEELAQNISEASLFAELDSYRAATNNKGVLNGMDAVALATGNDWRAVEAGVHAYAARSGQYRSITKWHAKGNRLEGILTAPVVVGTVGGVTRLHPTAQLCLSMMKVASSEELSRVIAAVGLVQNLGALRALTTDGIVQGHMRLHVANLVLASGANSQESQKLQQRLVDYLQRERKVSLSDAQNILIDLRKESRAANLGS